MILEVTTIETINEEFIPRSSLVEAQSIKHITFYTSNLSQILPIVTTTNRLTVS